MLALGLALLVPGTAAAAPSASFTFSPSNPSPGETVAFSASTDPSIVQYQWDIAGHPASGDTATAVFLNPGSYHVRLTVTDFMGSSKSTTRTVDVGAVADFSVSPSSPMAGESVTFKSRSTGNVADEAWDFDDDGSIDAHGSTATWTYDTPGRYKARLRVTDSSGNTSTASKSIDVTSPNPSPHASFSFSPSNPTPGATVDLRSKSDDPNGDIVEESWDLNGDGQFGDATGSTAQTTFATAGKYDVGLRVTDATGNIDTTTKTVKVEGPAAMFTFSPATPVTGETVTFTAADGTVRKLSWDLNGDGKFDDAKGATATWTYTKPGNVTISLEAKDDHGKKATSFQTVQIYAPGTVPVPPGPPPAPPPPGGTGKSGPGSGGSPGGQRQTLRPPLLAPFPVIRIRGRIFRGSSSVDILSVLAPRGATIHVRCRGRGCPRRTLRLRARSSRRAQRVHAFERRLPAGVVLEIRVTKSGRIGKYTRFVIRAGAAPSRRDMCVGPTSRSPVRCPAQ